MADTIKCLSIRQPWAWCILHAGKDVENRTWATRHTGWLLIHAGLAAPHRVELYLIEQRFGLTLPALASYDRGAIVGAVYLMGCAPSTSRWAEAGQCHWRLSRPLAFTHPIPYKGRLGLFDVPRDLVREAIKEAYLAEKMEVLHGCVA